MVLFPNTFLQPIEREALEIHISNQGTRRPGGCAVLACVSHTVRRRKALALGTDASVSTLPEHRAEQHELPGVKFSTAARGQGL